MKTLFTKEFGIGLKTSDKLYKGLGLNRRLAEIRTLTGSQHKKLKGMYLSLILGKNLKNLINDSLMLKRRIRIHKFSKKNLSKVPIFQNVKKKKK